MRILQVSDTHLSATLPHFARNCEIIAASLATHASDLIIHTGDLSMDGVLRLEDLDLSRRWNDALPVEVLTVPGNHDVGDLASIRAGQALDDARLETWRRVIGPDRWLRDQGGWRLIGLNAMLFATGHAEEEAQFEWLPSALDTTDPIAIFLHKPLCIERLDEGARGYWTVAPEPRARLTALLAGKPVKMIASGHLHIQHQHLVDGVNHVWSPAGSFVVGASQEDMGGERRIGFVEHIFEADKVTSRFIRPDGVEDLVLDDVREEIYPTGK